MQRESLFPEKNRFSLVTAMIMLAYATAAFVRLPENEFSLQLPGFFFVAKLNFYTILSVVVAVIAAAGTDWVIAGHPHLGESRRWHHLIIPAMTAVVIGVPLNQIAVGGAWWVIFFMGGALFTAVLVAEYISVDLSDSLYPMAVMGLSVVSLVLFLVLVISIRGAGARLYTLLSATVPAAALVSARILNLRSMNKWPLHWILGIGIVIGQFCLCLFYLPVEPIPFGLLLTGAVYALTGLAANFEEQNTGNRIWVEPGLVFIIFSLLALLL